MARLVDSAAGLICDQLDAPQFAEFLAKDGAWQREAIRKIGKV